jgi:hypothetical protein
MFKATITNNRKRENLKKKKKKKSKTTPISKGGLDNYPKWLPIPPSYQLRLVCTTPLRNLHKNHIKDKQELLVRKNKQVKSKETLNDT